LSDEASRLAKQNNLLQELAEKLGEPVVEIGKGDVIWIPAGTKHWHGATPTSSMTHVAITEQLDGNAVTWLETDSDNQYRK